MVSLRHRVFDLIWSFRSDEINDFDKFIASSLHSRGRNYELLLKTILRYKDKDRNSISPKEFYSVLYPGKSYSGQTLKNRLTELLKLAESFLVYSKLNQEHIEKDKMLLEEYLSRRLTKLFEIKYRKTKKFVATLPVNEYKFKNMQFLNEINLSLLDKKNTLDEMHKQYYEHAKYSLYIFLIEVFEHGIHFRINELDNIKITPNIITDFLETFNVEHLIEGFAKSDDVMLKVVCIFYYLYRAINTFDEKDEHFYFQATKIFSECNKHLGNDYTIKIYEQIINYCIVRQNYGSEKFQNELFRVYDEKLKQGFYQEFRQLSYPVNTFRDYVLIGIELKEFKWVADFIKKYSKELPEEIHDDEVNLSYAKLFFAEGNFEQSLRHLSKVRGLNYLHYADASVLKMCCYYELNKLEDSFYEIDKLRHYIRNQKGMSPIHKTPNVNFLKIYQKLVNSKSKPEKGRIDFLEKEVRKLVFISKGKWLVEKIKGG